MTIKLYKTEAEINKATDSLKSRGSSLQKDAHILACSVLAHVAEHHDIRVLSRFLAAFPDMARVNAVRSWFEAFGPVTFNGNTPSYVKDGKTRLGDAMETPFWKFKPEPEYKPIDRDAALDTLIKRLEKDQAITERDHSALITSLKLIKLEPAKIIPLQQAA